MTTEEYIGTNPYGNNSKMAKIVISQISYLPLATIKQTGNHILSMWMFSETNQIVTLCYGDKNVELNSTTSWQLFENRFEVYVNDIVYLKFYPGTYYIWHAKLERGNKPTDWSPAPEDTEESITEVKTIAEQTSDKFSWIVKSGTSATNFELTDRTANLVANHINLNGLVTFSGLGSDAQSKINSAENTANTANSNASTALSTANSANATANSASSTANSALSTANTANSNASSAISTANNANSNASTALNTVNNIEIGGRNLFKSTGIEIINNEYNIAVYKPASEPLIEGEEYTVSMCVTPATNVTCFSLYLSNGFQEQIKLTTNGTEKQILSGTFTAKYRENRKPSDDIINANAKFYRYPNDGTVTGNSTIHWVKIEKGNKATDWSPAPEDISVENIYTPNTTTIDGGKITTGSIKADKLVAKSITADKLDVTNIFGDSAVLKEIFAQNITATGTITGATLKGAHVESTSGSIGGFDIGEGSISLSGTGGSSTFYTGLTNKTLNGDAFGSLTSYRKMSGAGTVYGDYVQISHGGIEAGTISGTTPTYTPSFRVSGDSITIGDIASLEIKNNELIGIFDGTTPTIVTRTLTLNAMSLAGNYDGETAGTIESISGYVVLAVIPRTSGSTDVCWINCYFDSSNVVHARLKNTSSSAKNNFKPTVEVLYRLI